MYIGQCNLYLSVAAFRNATTKVRLLVPLVLVFLGVFSGNKAFAQCGAEPITAIDWCENTFAGWTFTSPTANATYHWYSYVDASTITNADLDVNGLIIRNGVTSYGSTTASTYYTPYRVRQADHPTGVSLTYVKKVGYNAVPYPATAPTFTQQAPGAAYSMSFNTTTPIRINSVKIPVVLNNPGAQYKIQINFGSLGGAGSAVYTFSTVSATHISGNRYIIEVPVNFTTGTGAQTMVVNTNPTGGTGVQVDGVLFSSVAASTTGPLTVSASTSAIYDWDFTVTCPPRNTPVANRKTTGCCVPPTSVGLLSLASDISAIVNNGTVNATLTVGSGDPANYFAWYLDGVLQTAMSGVGRTSNTTNRTGTWEVREVRNQADLATPGCEVSASVVIQDRVVFATQTSAPTNNPLCIGDQWTFTGTGSSNLTWSSGGGTFSTTTGSPTTFTATQTGMTKVILTGEVVTGNLIVNGDFSQANNYNFTSQLTQVTNPTATDGGYIIASNSLNNGTWTNSDWTYNNTRPSVNGNPGNFLIVNGAGQTTDNPPFPLNPMIWGQKVSVTQGKEYTFSFDLTSVTYVISTNTENYSAATATAPWKDVVLDIYINGTLVGTAGTDFASNGGLDAVGIWKKHSFTWTANSTEATIEIRQRNGQKRGWDYGLDNISFGGLSTQTDEITIGPVTDCSTISATASPCVDDTMSTLTAVVTNGLIFKRWELASAPGVAVSTTNPFSVKSVTPTSYNAVGVLAGANVLQNGNFESGNVGFIAGSAGGYYTYSATNLTNGGNNQFNISTDTRNGNGAWLAKGAPTGGPPTRIFAADAKGPLNQKIIAWEFTATAGTEYFFSGWAANHHIDFTNTNAVNAQPARIGVLITPAGGTPNPATDQQLTEFNLGRDTVWTNRQAVWTAPANGVYTLYLTDRNGTSGGSNDFVLDDFSLRPAIGTEKKALVTTPLCDPCLIKPTVVDSFYCANTGIVSVNPHPSDVNGVKYNWYTAATGGTLIGTTVGNLRDTIDVSGIAKDAQGYKTVYYSRSAKGSGTVFKRSESCNANFNDFQNWSNGVLGSGNYLPRFTTTTPVKITEFDMMIRTSMWSPGTLTANMTFRIVGSKTGNGGAIVADLTNVIGTFNYTYTRTFVSGQPQDLDALISIPVNVTVPAGEFFIVGQNVNITGNGNFNVGRANCAQTVPRVDDLNGTTIRLTGGSDVNNNNQSPIGGHFFNVDFEIPAYACPRIPVKLTESCPCNPPATVTITTTPANTVTSGIKTITVCSGAGTLATLSGAFTAGTGTNTNPYQYSWYKKGDNPVYVNSTTIANKTLTAADAGVWVLRVEDYNGSSASASCYKEDSVRFVVNTVPDLFVTNPDAVCAPDKVDITWSSVGNSATSTVPTGTVFTYLQSDKTTAITAANAAVIATSGTYYIVGTSNNCSDTAAVTVSIKPKPDITYITPDTTLCSGLELKLNSAVSSAGAGPKTYSWTGPGGYTSSVEDPQISAAVTPSHTGTYQLIYTDNGCKDTATVDVTVYQTPDLTVTNPAAVCSPQTVNITWPMVGNTGASTVPAGTTFSYLQADKVTAVSTPAAVNTSGTYYVVGSSNSCRDTVAVAVDINPTPTAPVVTINPNTAPFCVGEAYNLTASSTVSSGVITYTWTGAATGTGATKAGVTTAGTHNYSVVAETNGCKTVATISTVTVNPLPTPSIPAQTALCEGAVRNVSVASPNPTSTYAWTVTGTGVTHNSSTTGTISVTAGTDNITLSVIETNANGCSNTTAATQTIAVDRNPTVAAVSDPTLTVCIADPINMNGNAAAVGTGLWTWSSSLGAGSTVTISPAGSPTASLQNLQANEVITAKWTISNGVCAPTDATVQITGAGIAAPTVTLTADKNQLCEGGQVEFTASGTGGGSNPLYTFFDNNNNILQAEGTSNTYIMTPAADVIVYVRLRSNSTCLGTNPATVNSATQTIQVDRNPTTPVLTGVTETCLNCETITMNPITIGTVSWDVTTTDGTVGTTTATSAELCGLVSGQASTIRVTVSNGLCVAKTATHTVTKKADLTLPVTGGSGTFCSTTTSVNLTGNTPATGESGTWYAVAPATVSQTGNNATGQNLQIGENKFYYTISNGLCTPVTDTVYINIDQDVVQPVFSPISAPTCADSYVLAAPAVTVGTGKWTKQSGQGSFADDTDPNTTLTGLIAENQSTVVRWTVSNGVCTPKFAEFTVNKAGSVTTPQLNLDGGAFTNKDVTEGTEELCLGTNYTLTAPVVTLKTGESGSWGTPTGSSVSINTSTGVLTLNSTGQTVLTYTVTTTIPGCAPVSRKVTLNVNDRPAAPSITGPSGVICQGSSGHNFTINAVPGATDYTWTPSTGINLNVAANKLSAAASVTATAISGTIQVDATNSCGSRSSTIPVTITPTENQAVTIQASNLTPCANENVTFTATPSNAGTSPTFRWYRNDVLQTEVTDQLVLNGPLSTTKEEVYVEITSGYACPSPTDGKAVSARINLDVQPMVTPSVTISPVTFGTICQGQPITFTATPVHLGNAGTISWSASGGTPASGTGTSFTTSLSATSAVTATITSTANCVTSPTDQATVNVPITPNEAVTVSLNTAGPVCEGASGQTFTATPVSGFAGAQTYTWELNDVIQSLPTSQNTFTLPSTLAPGSYKVEVTMRTDKECYINQTDIKQQTYVVNPNPVPTIGGPGIYCEGTSATLTASPTGANFQYNWYKGTSTVPVSSGASLVITPGNDGIYSLEVINTLTNCSAKSNGHAVNEFKTNPIINSNTWPDFTKCSGDPIDLTVNPAGNITQWTLTVNGVTTPKGQVATINTLEPGIYTASVTINAGPTTSCSKDATVEVIDVPRPAPVINEAPIVMCEGEVYPLTVSDPNYNPITGTVTWYRNNQNQPLGVQVNNTYPVLTTGYYFVKEDIGKCHTYSDSVYIEVEKYPIANAGPDRYIVQGEAVDLSGYLSQRAVNYSWSSNQYPANYMVPLTADGSNVSVRPDSSQTKFYLTVTSAVAGCSDIDSMVVYVEKRPRPWNSFSPNGDGVYDTWIIENLADFPNALVEVYNRWGNLVWKSTGYKEPWRGENFRNNQELPIATYYYIIYPNGGKVDEPITGHVTIVK